MNKIDSIFTEDAVQFANAYLGYLSEILKGIDRKSISQFIKILLDARDRGSRVYFIGNGGSATTASHFANDLAVGTNSYEKPFRVMSLTDNQAVITAISNDFGYNEIFARQLRILGERGDVLVGISASGNSSNLISAFKYAKSVDIKTVAITAFDGGELRKISDYNIHVPTGKNEYGPAEDAHMILDHLIGAYLARYVLIGSKN